jgi:hypothetical protein
LSRLEPMGREEFRQLLLKPRYSRPLASCSSLGCVQS